ncbi:hypothetical protein SKAU_G00417730 [Synaphobranchus kaupii]|uniref:Uncharacterized protein n=1 Tax=Synaphobranchus kaupii TaxID=118154 RepID=A0A9Q1E602_SYNKA|nr:hypothetical protein SKAU_G00417730 [Synaphobranchus kaupii]
MARRVMVKLQEAGRTEGPACLSRNTHFATRLTTGQASQDSRRHRKGSSPHFRITPAFLISSGPTPHVQTARFSPRLQAIIPVQGRSVRTTDLFRELRSRPKPKSPYHPPAEVFFCVICDKPNKLAFDETCSK